MAETALTVRIVPKDGLTEYNIKLTRVLTAEARGEEIACVTPAKAPELLMTFNRAYLDASEAHSRLKYEETRAETAVALIRSTILLEKIPKILEEKKLSSSADVRQAIIDADPEFREAQERLDLIQAMIEYVKGKAKFLENCYTAVKKIMDTGNWNHTMTRAAQGDRLTATLGETENTEVGRAAPQFGKARF